MTWYPVVATLSPTTACAWGRVFMPIIISTVVLVGLYSGLALLIAGSDSVAFDTLPLAAAVAGALLLSAIVFWPDGGGASSAGSGEVRRQPELLAFVAFARRTHELADNPHRTREGAEALAARLRERMEVAANHPVRLVWPEQWTNAPVDRMRLGMEAGVMLRRRAVAALRRDGTPEPVADRLREDGDAWRFLGIGDVIALARIHTESKVEIGERFVVFSTAGAGGAPAPPGKLILAFLIPRPGAPAIPAEVRPEMERFLETRLRDLLGLPSVPLELIFPDKWTGGPLGSVDDVLGERRRIALAAPIATALEACGFAPGTAARFLGDAKWDCLDLAEFGHLLLYGVTRGALPGADPAADAAAEPEPEMTAIVGFVIHPRDSHAAATEFVADLRPGALAERLASELSRPGAPVTIYHSGDWTPPPVATGGDIHRDAVLRGIAQAAFERVLADGVDDNLARGALGDGAFETLMLPTSGRVVLFREITGTARALGGLI